MWRLREWSGQIMWERQRRVDTRLNHWRVNDSTSVKEPRQSEKLKPSVHHSKREVIMHNNFQSLLYNTGLNNVPFVIIFNVRFKSLSVIDTFFLDCQCDSCNCKHVRNEGTDIFWLTSQSSLATRGFFPRVSGFTASHNIYDFIFVLPLTNASVLYIVLRNLHVKSINIAFSSFP